MSGHSKWSNIKHRKNLQNKKKEKIITKAISNIVTAIKLEKCSNADNYRLKQAVNKALSLNISKELIKKTIDRCSKNYDNNEKLSNVLYEGYSPGNIALIIDCLVKNKNKSASLIRHKMSKYGGKLSKQGSALYLFNKYYVLNIENTKFSKDEILNNINQLERKNIEFKENGFFSLNVNFLYIKVIKKIIKKMNLKIISLKDQLIPVKIIKTSKENKINLINLINELLEYNDIKNIYHNCKLI